MKRYTTRILLLAVLALWAATGCHQKTTTVERSERIEKSEPRMVSPGEPVVE